VVDHIFLIAFVRLLIDVEKAEAVLGWKGQPDLQAMCADRWRWKRNNPQGYKGC
jgi:UDP-glucose 4-epimerase